MTDVPRLDVPPAIRALIRLLIDDPSALTWWDTPQAALDGRSPRDMWRDNDTTRLRLMVLIYTML